MCAVKRILIFFSCLAAAGIVGAASPCGSAELGGYTFSDDSTHLYLNPFFSNSNRDVDFLATLYGYGDFAGSQVLQSHHQYFTLGGIPCNVVLERGYFPDYSSGSPPDMIHYTAYHYYAKDTEDNIHVLQYSFHPDGGPSIGWSYTDLPEGMTTLKYPAEAQPGQEVFFGSVTGTEVRVGDIRGCVTIEFDSLPHAPSETITEYLVSGGGILASSFNWEGGINGFSTDAVAPEYAEEEGSAWEEWWDDNCFISVCSPAGERPGRSLRKAIGSKISRLREARETP